MLCLACKPAAKGSHVCWWDGESDLYHTSYRMNSRRVEKAKKRSSDIKMPQSTCRWNTRAKPSLWHPTFHQQKAPFFIFLVNKPEHSYFTSSVHSHLCLTVTVMQMHVVLCNMRIKSPEGNTAPKQDRQKSRGELNKQQPSWTNTTPEHGMIDCHARHEVPSEGHLVDLQYEFHTDPTWASWTSE